MPTTKKNKGSKQKNLNMRDKNTTIVIKSTSKKILFPEKVKAANKFLKHATLLPS